MSADGAPAAAGAAALAALVSRLELEPTATGFVGDPGPGSGRLFGGLVAAQSVIAAGRSEVAGQLHSLHAYFLRPGSHAPIRFEVDRIRDGRSFSTRRVVALQDDEAIFNLSASFARPEDGISHQDAMPAAPPPEDVPLYRSWSGDARGSRGPIELRACDDDEPDPERGSLRRVWMRPTGTLPEDPLLHAALVVFASDRTLLSTGARGHGIARGERRAASLDHAVWLHAPPRFDDWLLYTMASPVSHAARAWVQGAMFTRAGLRIATVAQEGLVRRQRARPEPS